MVTLKGSIDNTNDLKQNINHISSSKHLGQEECQELATISPSPLPSKALQEKEEEFERAALGDFFFITPTNSFPKPASESHTETRVPSKIITKNISEEQTLRWTAQQLVLLKAKDNEFLLNSQLFDTERISKQKLGKYDIIID